MKRFLTIALMICMCLAIGVFADEAKPVTVTLNGETVDCASYGQEATIVEGRTLVPLRAIFEALGATVEWDAETRTVDSKLGETEISLTIGENKLIKNGEEIALDVPAMIMNGRTLVPVRAVSESFGVFVEWDSQNRTVVLDKKTASFGKLMFDMSKDEALAVIEGETEIYDTRIDIWDEEGIYNDDDEIIFGKGVNCEYISLDFDSNNVDGDYLDVITARTGYVSQEEANKILENMKSYYSRFEEYEDDGDFFCLVEDEFEFYSVDGGIIKDENSEKYYCYITMSPISFGGIRKVDKTGRLVYMNWHHAYGDFYFGMTKEDVWDRLPDENASVYEDEISILLPEECGEADNRITGDAAIETIDFEFENGKLQKMVLFTDYGARGECLETLENMTEYYGEPTDKKKGDEEYIWVVDGGNVKVTATVYCLENTLLIDPNYGYYVEIQIKYTGNAFDVPEEKEDEAESEEKEYIYGEYYFGMSWDEVKKAIDKFELRSVGGTAIRTFIEKNDLDFRVDLDDENGKYNDEDETVTGKTNIKKMSFYVEDKSLKGIAAETDSMTYAEADFVVKVFNERYGNPDIAIKDPEVYEWICEDKIITLDVCDNYGDKEKPFYVKFDLKKEKYRKNRSFNILDKIPLGLNLENASSYFPDSNEKMSQNKLEFFDIKDEEYIDYHDGFLGEDGECVDYKIGKKSWDKFYKTNIDEFYYVDENGRRRYDIKPGDFPLVETYSERNDVMGSEFDCTYIGFDLVDGVCDNCLVKTVDMPHNEAGHALISVVKYFGIDSAVYDAENNVYEWEKYNFGGMNGVSKVNICVGIAGAEKNKNRYYCYISIQIADSAEECEEETLPKTKAYGKFFFGMSLEEAKAAAKGEVKQLKMTGAGAVNEVALRITDEENEFDDEDWLITGKLDCEKIELIFKNDILYSVTVTIEHQENLKDASETYEKITDYYNLDEEIKNVFPKNWVEALRNEVDTSELLEDSELIEFPKRIEKYDYVNCFLCEKLDGGEKIGYYTSFDITNQWYYQYAMKQETKPEFADLLQKYPFGATKQQTINTFKGTTKLKENRIDIQNVQDQRRFVNDPTHRYYPEKDIYGQGFYCNYISIEYDDVGVDKFYARTEETISIDEATYSLNVILKLYGEKKAVFHEDKNVYEWKNHKYTIYDGTEKAANIYAGIIQVDSGKYYCFVSAQQVKDGVNSTLDEDGRITEAD